MNTRVPFDAAKALSLALSISIAPAARAVEFSDWCPPDHLGYVVNSTPYSDGGPAISKDGLSLYFHSNRPSTVPGTGGFDLYVSRRSSTDEPWGTPVNLGPIVNTPGVETVPALSRDGHWLFFNARNRAGGYGGFDLWASYRAHVHDDLAWEPPVNLGPGVNTAFNDSGAGYFENDAGGVPLLYFVSDRPGGPGRQDIYVSTQQPDGSWGPAALVEELSSPANDGRPSVRFDGLELFLNRDVDAPTVNDNDLYVSTRESVLDPWSAPVKLGSSVNGPVDDLRAHIAPDRTTLFFESGPNEPLGDMDIYVTTRTRKGECP